ncbi:class I SAM-dependent methyltransferase [Actinoplanes sp. NPDC024001]|uniref:class I SAM-dependent methyltransferase n=1 Tax=Actinoplanes sp. NPDC024001 TaxID=3154598 RepID=UPI0033FF4C5B
MAFDAAEPDRLRRRRNLEPDAAVLLTLVLRIARARTVVEIGTANGFSATWLADAVRDTGGHLTSVDVEPPTEAVVNRVAGRRHRPGRQGPAPGLAPAVTGQGADSSARIPAT